MDELEVKLDLSEGFANIDDLLGEKDTDTKDTIEGEVKDEPSVHEGGDGFDQDCADDVHIDLPKVAKTEDGVGSSDQANVFSSGLLDDLLGQKMEIAKREIFPTNLAMGGISEVKADAREVIEQQLEARETLEGLRAGLGQQQKSRMKMRMQNAAQSSKVKTLAMKREKLAADIMRFGVAAIEKLYPRQQQKQQSQARRKSTGSRRDSHKSPFKMKPAPHDVHFEEVDARKILKPFSHDKYIKEPEPGVVFVHRRDGLVPLNSLGREGRTLISSSPRLLAGRNLTLGKPAHYVKQGGRLVAVGGTRNKTNSSVKIVKVPTFDQDSNPLPLFQIDEELANFACSAVRPPASGKRVDIREMMRLRQRERDSLDSKLSLEKSLVEKMRIKLQWNKDQEGELPVLNEFDSNMARYKEAKTAKESDPTPTPREVDTIAEDFKSFNMGRMDYQKSIDHPAEPEEKENVQEPVLEVEDEFSKSDEEIDEEVRVQAAVEVVKNSWASAPRNVVPDELNLDECPPLRGYSVSSIKPVQRTPILTFEGYTGLDSCDVSECFCKEETAGKEKVESTPLTTSHSGSQTPSGSTPRKGPQRIAKDLLRVKRALKTLGVKIIEFDDHDGSDDTCTKDYCRLGCICDSLRTKQMPPSHCGKVECMFSCCCSKEALKYSSCGSRRVNISAAVGARIQEDSQRNMAVEERKFSNTVVVTSDKDAVMLGDRAGRGTRRERKLPQRYQNSNTLMLDVAGKEYVEKEVSSESDTEYDDDKMEDAFAELKRSEDIVPCTVVIPKVSLPKSCAIWCMYHCQYSCPCYKLRNPLDYGPDRSGSRNMAKRSLGNTFTTRLKRSEERSRSRSPEENIKDAELLGVEEIDPDLGKAKEDAVSPGGEEAPVIKAKKRRTVTSARTRGATVQQSSGVKLPYRPKKRRQGLLSTHLPDMEEVAKFSSSPVKKSKVRSDKHKEREEVTSKLSLKVQPKESRQYVRWDLFKKEFAIDERIDLWFWVRPTGRGKSMVFLTEHNVKPYIATAINMRNLQGRTNNLPGLVSECLKPKQERDSKMYVVLESNGTVWTLVSILANRKEVGEEEIRSLTLEAPPAQPSPAPESKMKVKDGSAKVSLAEAVQKLPVGQSLITVTDGGKAVMQVKLPPTLAGQYWSLISVGQGQSSIQCPDSSLVLKCAILQQAATLATATSTTVRIPIPVADQDQSFGVYAVPGLKTHVFVGPFKSKEDLGGGAIEDDDEDIVCLDDEIGKNDSEEVKVLKKSEELDKAERKKEQKKLVHKSRLLGQVPQVVGKETSARKDEEEDSDIDIIEEIAAEGKSSAAKVMKSELIKAAKDSPVSPAISRGKSTDHGKTVIQAVEKSVLTGTAVDIKFSKMVGGEDIETVYKARIENSGKVSMEHPKLAKHAVICPSVPAAKLWLENYYEELEEDGEEEEKTLDNTVGERRSPPPVLKLIKTPSLPSGANTDHISLFLQTKEQKDETALFYELGHTAFTKFFQKTISRAQILKKAKEEIQSLEKEGTELEASKVALLKRREKLFTNFTKSLEGLPVGKKKAAVIELKELLKKDKEPPANSSNSNLEARSDGRGKQSSEGAPCKTSGVPSSRASSHLSPAALPTVVSSLASPTPYTDVTGINTVRSDGTILRPMNAFMLWAKEKRVEMMKQGLQVAEVSQALSEQWKRLSDEEKGHYYREQDQLKELHKLQHPDYKYSPKMVSRPSSQPPPAPAPASSPPPIMPNQPPEDPEPNQPPAIQVPRPLSQLRNQSIILSKPRPSLSRPAPGLIPVQTYTRPSPGQNAPDTIIGQGGAQVQGLNIGQGTQQFQGMLGTPGTVSQNMIAPAAQELSSIPTVLTSKEPMSLHGSASSSKPILNIPSRAAVRMSSTFNPNIQLQEGAAMVPIEEQDVPVLSLPEPQGGLDLLDLPQDAADMLGLAVQSSGLELPESGQQYIIQGDNITPIATSDLRTLNIGGDNYEVVGDDSGQMDHGQVLLPSGLPTYHEEQQLLMAQQQQQAAEEQQQPVYVDQFGRQLILSAEQQMMIQQQLAQGGDQQVIFQDQDVMTID